MAWRILIVDDEPALQSMVGEILTQAGYETESALCCAQAVERFRTAAPDAVLLDVMLPGLDGFSVMARVASQGTPVIFLSAMQQVADKVRGLHLGAEDYIAKPFEALELLARVEVALRRRGKGREVLEYRGICQDLSSHTVTLNGKPVALSPKEFELLRVFLQNQDLALSRDKLLSLVWGYDFAGETRTVDIHVQRLRQKLGLSGKLVTLPRIGYRLEH